MPGKFGGFRPPKVPAHIWYLANTGAVFFWGWSFYMSIENGAYKLSMRLPFIDHDAPPEYVLEHQKKYLDPPTSGKFAPSQSYGSGR